MIKALLFDVLGTVVDLSIADKSDILAYANHIKQDVWQPLTLPSYWEHLPAFIDSAVGLDILRKKFTVVTCSNPPLGFLLRLSKNNGLNWDAIVPLELARVYKTNPAAYQHVADTIGLKPHECLMVTANRTFGDLEAANSIGMPSMLIDRKGETGSEVQTLFSLARRLQ